MAASVSTPGSILMEVIYLIPGKLKINDHLGSLTWKTSHKEFFSWWFWVLVEVLFLCASNQVYAHFLQGFPLQLVSMTLICKSPTLALWVSWLTCSWVRVNCQESGAARSFNYYKIKMLSDMKTLCLSLTDSIPSPLFSGAKTQVHLAIGDISDLMKYGGFSFGGVWVSKPLRHRNTWGHYVIVADFHFELYLIGGWLYQWI